MKTIEIGLLSLMLAFADAVEDMCEYFLYFLIPLSFYGCGGLNVVFGMLLLVRTVATFINNPCSGWIVDATEAHPRASLRVSSWLRFATDALVIVIAAPATFWVSDWGWMSPAVPLVILFLLQQFALVLNTTSIWKIIKMRCYESVAKEHPKDSKETLVLHQEKLISRIGANNEIISDVYEVFFLLLAYCFASFGESFGLASLVLILSILMGDLGIAAIAMVLPHNGEYQYLRSRCPRWMSLMGDATSRGHERVGGGDDDAHGGDSEDDDNEKDGKPYEEDVELALLAANAAVHNGGAHAHTR